MCAIAEGFSGEGPVNSLELQSDYAAHFKQVHVVLVKTQFVQ